MAHILIVDDSKLQRNFLKSILQEEGYTSTEAENGRIALDLLEQSQPDCVLLDLLMPECSGREVLFELKARGSRVPVVVVSADIQQSTIQECLDLGACNFLNKPVKSAQLVEVLHQTIGAAMCGDRS